MNRIKVNFTDFWSPPPPPHRNPFFLMLSRKFNLEISNEPDYLFYSVFGKDYLNYDCVRIFCTAENARPNFKECDYAFGFDYPITRRNYRLPGYLWRRNLYDQLKLPKDVDALVAGKKKFCNFIYSNPWCATRNRFFEQLSARKFVESAGRFRNNISRPLEIGGGGGVEGKLDFMAPFKFSIAFENESYPGYTTEKILHAMTANTIPIYWGNPLVHLEFNPKSFINCHEYDSFDEVIEHVMEVDRSEALYRNYLAEPYLYDNRVLDYLTQDAVETRFERIFSTRERRRNGPLSPHLKLPRYPRPPMVYLFEAARRIRWRYG